MQEVPSRRVRHLPEPVNTEYVYSPETTEPHLRDYWRMLVKRRSLVLLVFLTILGIGVFITLQTPRLYTASALVRIERKNTAIIGSTGVVTESIEYAETQVSLLRSRALAQRVIAGLGLEANPKFIAKPTPIDQLKAWLYWPAMSIVALMSPPAGPEPAPTPEATSSRAEGQASTPQKPTVPSWLIARYLGFLQVQPVPKTELVRVSFSTHYPQLSQELANAHVAAFLRMDLETRFELTVEVREFLEKKLEELKANIERSEEMLNHFLETHNVISLSGSENVVLDRLLDLNRRLTEARSKRIELEALHRTMKNKNVQYLTQVMNNNSVQQLKGRLDTLQAEEARLLSLFRPDHPRLLEVGGEISEARQRLSAEIMTVVRGVEADYYAAHGRESALEAEVDQQRQAALRLKELGAQHTLLQGDVEANRAVYNAIVHKLSETSVSKDSPLANIQIIESAETPLFPSSPAIIRNLQLASAFGLFFGVGLAFLLEYFSSTVRTPGDVWRVVAIPTLAVVPHSRALRRWPFSFRRLSRWYSLRALVSPRATAGPVIPPALIALHSPLSIILESYRAARTAILSSQSSPPQVILITSANPGEGKTTAAVNLGITLAQSGRKVLVVDADLRNGNCHTLLHVRKSYGLSDILTSDITGEDCVQVTQIEGLFFLSRGTTQRNTADLLGSNKMLEIIQDMRARFDIVLLDSPPAIAVSDAAILATQSDGVLVVLRAQETTTKTLQHLVEDLDMVGARILGVMLTGVDFRDPDYVDYSRYYKSYYYAKTDNNR